MFHVAHELSSIIVLGLLVPYCQFTDFQAAALLAFGREKEKRKSCDEISNTRCSLCCSTNIASTQTYGLGANRDRPTSTCFLSFRSERQFGPTACRPLSSGYLHSFSNCAGTAVLLCWPQLLILFQFQVEP